MGIEVEPRAIVLRHSFPEPVPAVPSADAAASSQLATGSPEVNKLVQKRTAFYQRLRVLRAAGLSIQSALALLRTRTGGDFAAMVTILLGTADGRRKVQLRFNQLGLKVRELKGTAS